MVTDVRITAQFISQCVVFAVHWQNLGGNEAVNLTFMEPCIARCVFYITDEMQLIQCSLLLSAIYMFRAVFPPIIRSL